MVTDIKKVKEITKSMFDLIPLREAITENPVFPSHTFTNSSIVCIGGSIINLMEEPDKIDVYRNEIFKLIDSADSLIFLMMIVNKPYMLLWFKLIHRYLNPEDYGMLLREVWIHSEYPNTDVNVPVEECIQFFKHADIEQVMEQDDKRYYDSLPDVVTVWRGVTRGKNPYGISYTLDKDKAIWFKNRFSNPEQPGILIELEVPKKDILAYINSRNEKEVIINISKYRQDLEQLVAIGKEVISYVS